MAIRITRNEQGNCITFVGSSNPAYWNACLSAQINATDTSRIDIINDIRSANSAETQYEFYAVSYLEFADKDGIAFASAQELVDYINVNANVSAPADINIGYKGVFDASTNLAPTDASPVNGDWYYIGTAGTIDTVDYEVNDIIKYSDTDTAWGQVKSAFATVTELESSALDFYDHYVDGDYTGTIRSGTAIHPYSDLADAIAASNPRDTIFIEGVISIANSSGPAFTLPHGLHFYGAAESYVQYTTYDANNGDIFLYEGTDNSQDFLFNNLRIKNAGGYGIHLKKLSKITIEDCVISNNGWNGQGLSTIAAEAGSVLGYDSTNTALQSFYAGANASNGGGMRIEESTQVLIVGNTITKNLRGMRIQDCGVGGGGFITRNQSTQNVESGIYLAAGLTYAGCQNITVSMNVSAYNSNNGLLSIGGINNKFSQNEVNGNWNAGFCSWGAANTTLRDCGLYDNNRSQYNGIGNTGDAKASIQINEAYDLLGTTITVNPAFRFIAEILDTQVHYTGLGSNTEKIGFLITSAVGALANNSKNIIKVDDVGFIGQDYAIDLSEVDVSNLRLSLGDNSFQSITYKAVKAPLVGNYNELPFSNHVMEVPEVDVVVDTLKHMITLTEGVGGNTINTYQANELTSVIQNGHVDILQANSDKIQLRGLSLGNVYINGIVAGSNINTMNDSLNAAFNMSLVEYKQFLESEVGVSGGGNVATFYYIESPDNNFEYPLFKTQAEAEAFSTENGGSGYNTQTYDDDLTNTTWYVPTVLFVDNGTSAPLNGVYGTSTSIIWNIQTTAADANYAPTFTDIVYTIQEGSAVNIQYKPQGDTDVYNVTNIPTGYADTGNAIVGTADEILDGIDIQHTINVTRANDFGSDTGIITLNVTDDPTNNATSNSTSWTKTLDFSGSNEHLKQVSNLSFANALRMDHKALTTTAPTWATGTSASHHAKPWATAVVFNIDNNTSHQVIWNQGGGANNGNYNIYLKVLNKRLYFGWGREGTGYNECMIHPTPSAPTGFLGHNAWYGVYIAHNGTRLNATDATASNLADAFDIRLMNSAGNNWTLGSNLSVAAAWTSTGYRMDELIDDVFSIGGMETNRSFQGEIASMVITTLKKDVAMPSDAEITKMIKDPTGWLTDYKIGNNYRYNVSNSSNFQIGVLQPSLATQVWLMGDGTDDFYFNGIRNQVYSAEQNYGKLQFNNMQSTDIQNVSINGLS